jgi:hypothetical protein
MMLNLLHVFGVMFAKGVNRSTVFVRGCTYMLCIHLCVQLQCIKRYRSAVGTYQSLAETVRVHVNRNSDSELLSAIVKSDKFRDRHDTCFANRIGFHDRGKSRGQVHQ